MSKCLPLLKSPPMKQRYPTHRGWAILTGGGGWDTFPLIQGLGSSNPARSAPPRQWGLSENESFSSKVGGAFAHNTLLLL